MSRLPEQFGDAEFYFEQDVAPPHIRYNVRTYVDKSIRNR